jgi:hypothetical protein
MRALEITKARGIAPVPGKKSTRRVFEERHIACSAADVEDLHPQRAAGILEEVSRRRVEELGSLFEPSGLFFRPAHDVCGIVFHGDRPRSELARY